MKTRTQLAFSLAIVLFAGTVPGAAQSTELLELETITVGNAGPVTFKFSDHGTGASGYTVRSASSVGEPIVWENEPGAVVQSLGNGQYQVTVAQGSPDRFYSVSGANGNAAPIQIGFASTAFTVNEGGSVAPTITFSRAYHGTIRYSIEGNADDYSGLTGEIQVNGTSAVIPVNLTENNDIDALKQLVLTLVSGSGAKTGAASEVTITIGENDADWQGALFDEATTIGFTVRIRRGDNSTTATATSDGSGIVPSGEFPATISIRQDVFSLLSSEIPLDTATTFQSLPATLKWDLDAANGQTDESVAEREIQGHGKLIIQYPGNAHLNRTNTGPFILVQQPVAPSTTPLELVDLP